MPANSAQVTSRLTDLVTVRAPSGFGDQIRAAARAEGLRPGALIREAISERIDRAGGDMTGEDCEAVAKLGGECAETDDALRADLERRVDAFRGPFLDHIRAAHEHLSYYLATRALIEPPHAFDEEAAEVSVQMLNAAFAELQVAQQLEHDLGRIALLGTES